MQRDVVEQFVRFIQHRMWFETLDGETRIRLQPKFPGTFLRKIQHVDRPHAPHNFQVSHYQEKQKHFCKASARKKEKTES